MKISYISILILSCVACTGITHEGVRADRNEEVSVHLDCGGFCLKSSIDSDDGLWDVNLYIFAEDGMEEFHSYTSYPRAAQKEADIKARMILGRHYSILAFANAGYDTGDFSDIGSLLEWKFYLSYPDGGNRGIPMSGIIRDYLFDGGGINMNLERMMSKVSVFLDRSKLNGDVDFHIMKLTVGNCPRCATPFAMSRVRDDADLFAEGYSCEWPGGTRSSVHADLYLLENMQEKLDRELCSYVELEIDYNSDLYTSAKGKTLKYRFFIRENDRFNVQRGCHYNVTVCPENDGLSCEDRWRVDKSALTSRDDTPSLSIFPEGTSVEGQFYSHYYQMKKGETKHFDIISSPPSMKISLREDLVDDEKKEGRAEYTLDSDGKGFSVKSLGKSCSSMMEINAAAPLDDFLMIVIDIE